MNKNKNRMEREMRYCLRRSPALNHSEFRLLSFVATFEHGCLLSYDKIAEFVCMSERTIERTVASLKKLELLEVKYRAYKKTTLLIADGSKQKEFCDKTATHGGTVNRHPWRPYPPPMAASTATHGGTNTEIPLERKLESDLNNGKDGWPNVATINSILEKSRFGKKTRLEK